MTETFWAIDATEWPGCDADKLRFIRYTVENDRLKKVEERVSNVAPSAEVRILGDYDSCQDWRYCFRNTLNECIRRRTESVPTLYERILAEDS